MFMDEPDESGVSIQTIFIVASVCGFLIFFLLLILIYFTLRRRPDGTHCWQSPRGYNQEKKHLSECQRKLVTTGDDILKPLSKNSELFPPSSEALFKCRPITHAPQRSSTMSDIHMVHSGSNSSQLPILSTPEKEVDDSMNSKGMVTSKTTGFINEFSGPAPILRALRNGGRTLVNSVTHPALSSELTRPTTLSSSLSISRDSAAQKLHSPVGNEEKVVTGSVYYIPTNSGNSSLRPLTTIGSCKYIVNNGQMFSTSQPKFDGHLSGHIVNVTKIAANTRYAESEEAAPNGIFATQSSQKDPLALNCMSTDVNGLPDVAKCNSTCTSGVNNMSNHFLTVVSSSSPSSQSPTQDTQSITMVPSLEQRSKSKIYYEVVV